MAPMSGKTFLLAFCLGSAASALHGCVGLGDDEAAGNTGGSTNTQIVPGADQDDTYHFWCTNDFMKWVATNIVDNLGGSIDCRKYDDQTVPVDDAEDAENTDSGVGGNTNANEKNRQ